MLMSALILYFFSKQEALILFVTCIWPDAGGQVQCHCLCLVTDGRHLVLHQGKKLFLCSLHSVDPFFQEMQMR